MALAVFLYKLFDDLSVVSVEQEGSSTTYGDTASRCSSEGTDGVADTFNARGLSCLRGIDIKSVIFRADKEMAGDGQEPR